MRGKWSKIINIIIRIIIRITSEWLLYRRRQLASSRMLSCHLHTRPWERRSGTAASVYVLFKSDASGQSISHCGPSAHPTPPPRLCPRRRVDLVNKYIIQRRLRSCIRCTGEWVGHGGGGAQEQRGHANARCLRETGVGSTRQKTPQKHKIAPPTRTNVNNVTCHAADMIIHQLDGCHFVGVQFANAPAGAELVGQTCAAAFTRSSAAKMVGELRGEAAFTTRGCSADPRTATGPGIAHRAPSGEEGGKSGRVETTAQRAHSTKPTQPH